MNPYHDERGKFTSGGQRMAMAAVVRRERVKAISGLRSEAGAARGMNEWRRGRVGTKGIPFRLVKINKGETMTAARNLQTRLLSLAGTGHYSKRK